MIELEKCSAGLPYRFDNPEMVARKTAAFRVCKAFNAIDGTDFKAQLRGFGRCLAASRNGCGSR